MTALAAFRVEFYLFISPPLFPLFHFQTLRAGNKIKLPLLPRQCFDKCVKISWYTGSWKSDP